MTTEGKEFIEKFITDLLELHTIETLTLAKRWNNIYFMRYNIDSPKFQEKGFRDRFCQLQTTLLKIKEEA